MVEVGGDIGFLVPSLLVSAPGATGKSTCPNGMNVWPDCNVAVSTIAPSSAMPGILLPAEAAAWAFVVMLTKRGPTGLSLPASSASLQTADDTSCAMRGQT